MSSRDYSIVEYYAEHENYRCGYCKCTDTNYSHGMWAHSMTVQDYQDLIDRGWRRSGRYCYKPTMHITCCPMYTIKCAALDFKLSKSQKKVLKRFHRFLSHGDTKASEDARSAGGSSGTSEPSGDTSEVVDIPDLHQKSLRAEKSANSAKVISVDPVLSGRIERSTTPGEQNNKEEKKSATASEVCDDQKTTGDTKLMSDASEPGKAVRPGVGQDGSRPPCKKAKLMRLERKQQKLVGQGYSPEEAERLLREGKKHVTQSKTLEDFLGGPLSDNPAHRIEIRLVRSSPPSLEFDQTSKQAHELYRKYQMSVHREPAEKCTFSQYMRFLVMSPLQQVIVSVDSQEFIDTLSQSHALFAKYQIAIHKELPEECNLTTFCEFLVESSIQSWVPSDGPSQGYGSFHQQYWLDGRLIAVGVIDILPRCVSSVYFYYDPDMGHLSLGTFASLRELSLVRSLHVHAPALQFYYMGFYIHTCPKMRYKASYSPSFLLCPETYSWHPVEQCRPKLDSRRYCRFDEDPNHTDPDGRVSTNEVLVLSHHRAMPYFIYRSIPKCCADQDPADMEEVEQYAQLVGMKCAKRMLLIRS